MEDQTSALEIEKNQLRKRMEKAEKKHKPFLLLHHFAQYLIDFAKRGIWPFKGNPVLGIIGIAVRLFMLLIFWAVQKNLFYVAITYTAVHLGSFLIGLLLSKYAKMLLKDLDIEASVTSFEYQKNRYKRYGIVDDKIVFEDGVVVENNIVSKKMQQDYGNISIYRMDLGEESGIYYKRFYDDEDTGVSINEKLASVQFNNKFGVIVDKGDELKAMVFLSPAAQLDMIKVPEMMHFSQIQFTNGLFKAAVGKQTAMPIPVDVYKWRSFMKNIKELDKYCFNCRKMADTAYNCLMKLDFIMEN